MANDSSKNPILLGLGGRTRRHVTASVALRTIRTDETAEGHLRTLGEVLAGYEEKDTVSISMLMRRALAMYADHVAAVEATPALLAEERERVREGSVVPSGHRNWFRPRSKGRPGTT